MNNFNNDKVVENYNNEISSKDNVSAVKNMSNINMQNNSSVVNNSNINSKSVSNQNVLHAPYRKRKPRGYRMVRRSNNK
jgi:hypothetical protein